jgi:hypothetical protein
MSPPTRANTDYLLGKLQQWNLRLLMLLLLDIFHRKLEIYGESAVK